MKRRANRESQKSFKILLVTGTPGVGKTQLARSLARKTGSVYLNIGEVVKKERLHSGYSRTVQSYITDDRRLTRWLGRYFLAQKGRMVIETSSVGECIPRQTGMMALVLRLDPVLLYQRLMARGWSRSKVWENVEAELIDVPLFEASQFLGSKRVFEIDTTRKTPQDVLKEALNILGHGREWHAGRANWLEKYDPILLWRQLQ